jgi:hypothetical protein
MTLSPLISPAGAGSNFVDCSQQKSVPVTKLFDILTGDGVEFEPAERRPLYQRVHPARVHFDGPIRVSSAPSDGRALYRRGSPRGRRRRPRPPCARAVSSSSPAGSGRRWTSTQSSRARARAFSGVHRPNFPWSTGADAPSTVRYASRNETIVPLCLRRESGHAADAAVPVTGTGGLGRHECQSVDRPWCCSLEITRR